MEIYKIENENKWGSTIPLKEMKHAKRKYTLIVLEFLNRYGNKDKAFKELRKYWVNNIHPLPPTEHPQYDSIRTYRYYMMQEFRKAYKHCVLDV